MKKRPVLFIVGALLVAGLVALLYTAPWKTDQPSDTDARPIKIAFNTWIGYSAFYIAEEKGFFEKRQISIETTVIDPLAEKNAALIRGDLDGMGGTIDSAIVSAANGVDGVIIFMFDRSNGTDGILVDQTISSIADLRNATIAVEEGFVGHFFLLYVLQKNGIDPSEVTIAPMSTDQAGAAFVAGKADVAVTWEPYLSTAKKREGARVLVSSADIEPILADTLLMSRDFVRQHPAETTALVAALIEANEYWIAHPEEGNEIVARRWGMPVAEVEDIMKTDELYDGEDQRKQFGTPSAPGTLPSYLQQCADLWLAAGVVEKEVDVVPLVDGSFASP